MSISGSNIDSSSRVASAPSKEFDRNKPFKKHKMIIVKEFAREEPVCIIGLLGCQLVKIATWAGYCQVGVRFDLTDQKSDSQDLHPSPTEQGVGFCPILVSGWSDQVNRMVRLVGCTWYLSSICTSFCSTTSRICIWFVLWTSKIPNFWWVKCWSWRGLTQCNDRSSSPPKLGFFSPSLNSKHPFPNPRENHY